MNREKRPKVNFVVKIGKVKVKVVLGDVTLEKVDCIVNAANGRLMHGGGVAGAVSRRGGRPLEDECKALMKKRGKRVPTGCAVYTSGGFVEAKYCIHAVGPVWKGGKNKERIKLRQAVRSVLRICEKLGVKSVSIPAISSGIFRYPKKLATIDISYPILRYIRETKPDTCLREIRLTNIDDPTTKLFLEWWKNYSLRMKKESEEKDKEKRNPKTSEKVEEVEEEDEVKKERVEEDQKE